MKFKHELTAKFKVRKELLKNGYEVDKGQFDGIKPGESVILRRDCIIGKTGDGDCFVKLSTGYEYFVEEKYKEKK